MNHEVAIQTAIGLIRFQNEALSSSIAAVGHRVVRGCTLLSDAFAINESVSLS
jgi:acetate kinase